MKKEIYKSFHLQKGAPVPALDSADPSNDEYFLEIILSNELVIH